MNNFDIYRTEDGSVSKYIHEDGSETAIKLVKSMQNILNPLTNEIESKFSNRNKYSIFISSSVGCYMKCKFCHLTLKNAEHIKLENEAVLNNLKEALKDMILFNPELKNKYIKLSWMGMGDAMNKPEMVSEVSLRFLDWVFENNFACGLDGVDLSTVMPKIKNKSWIKIYHNLEESLKKYSINPVYKMDNIEYTNNEYKNSCDYEFCCISITLISLLSQWFEFPLYRFHNCVATLVDPLVPQTFFEIWSYKIIQDLTRNRGCKILFYRTTLLYRHGSVVCCN